MIRILETDASEAITSKGCIRRRIRKEKASKEESAKEKTEKEKNTRRKTEKVRRGKREKTNRRANMTAALTVFLLFSAFIIQGCSDDSPKATIRTVLGEQTIYLEIADTPEKQRIGLMERTEMEDNHGMLFMFPEERQQSFWMKNTLIPLDMLFINARGYINDINEDAQPCPPQDCPVFLSRKPAKYVIEVKAGFVKKTLAEIGDKVMFSNILK